MKSKLYSLKDGAIEFTAPVAKDASDAAEIRGLSDEHLNALANCGIAGWSYRGAAKPANDGKTFSLVDLCTELCTVKVKDGDPSKADKEQASDLMQLYRIDADRADIPDEAKEHDEYPGDAVYRLDLCRVRFSRFVRNKTAEFSFDWNDTAYVTENVQEFCRALRLARARAERKRQGADLG